MTIESAGMAYLSDRLRQSEADNLALLTALRAIVGHRGKEKDAAYEKCHRQACVVLDDIEGRALDFDSDD